MERLAASSERSKRVPKMDGLDVRPVMLRGGEEDAEVGVVEFDRGVVGEEVAVEVRNVVRAEETTGVAHGCKEDGSFLLKPMGE